MQPFSRRLPLHQAARVARFATSSSGPFAAPASATNPHPYLVLSYVYDAKDAEEMVRKRTPLRPAHLEHARSNKALALGGAFAEAPIGAMLIFRTNDKKAVEDFAKADPYVTGGLVKEWKVREWTVVADHLTTGELR